MALYYLDASALVKHYILEPGSTWVRKLVNPLKAYDAVQLAVALRHSRALARHQLSLTFVTGDDALLTAARAESLLTDNPFDHVVPQDTPGP